MDFSDLSLGSSEENTNDNSSTIEKSKPDNEGNNFPICIEKNSNKKDQCQQECDGTEDSAAVAKASGSADQNETRKVHECESPICTSGMRSSSIFSPMTGKENLKHSQSRLSITSTDATFGSCSSYSVSSDDELLDNLEGIGELHESEDASDLAHGISGLPPTAVKNISNSPFTTSFVGEELVNESQTTKDADESSSLQEDCHSLKSPEMFTNLHEDDSPPMTMERPSNNFETDEMHFTKALASAEFLAAEKLPSNMNLTTVSPMPRKPSSNNTKEDETPHTFPGGGATGGFYDNGCDRQKDKSVKRKIRAGTMDMSDTNLTPTKRPTTSVSSASSRIGRSLLKISKSMEEISAKDDDWVFYETYGAKDGMKYITPKTWAKEILDFCFETKNANDTPRLNTESLLEEVHHFFQRNRVKADESLSWRESKLRILTSAYFSDEFARDHGLLSSEELVEKNLRELKCYTTSRMKNQLLRQELCKKLIECNIPEKTLIDYCEDRILIPQSNEEYSSSDQGSSLNYDIRRRLLWIAEEVGWDVVMDLYKKVTTEGASFLEILRDSENSATSVAEKIVRLGESRSPSQSSSHVPNLLLTEYQSTNFTDCERTLFPKLLVIDSPLRNEGNLSKYDKSKTESSRTHSRESKKKPGIILESDCHTMAGNQPCNKNIPLSTSETSKKSESSNDENAGKDGSNVSAENFESKADKTVYEE